ALRPANVPSVPSARQHCGSRSYIWLSYSSFGFDGLFAQEAQHLGIDFVCVSPEDAMWTTLDDIQTSPFDEFGRALSRRRNRNNAISVPMDDQCWHINAVQIFPEVLKPGWNTRQTSGCGCAGSDVPASLHDLLAHALTQELISVIEVLKEAGEKRVTIGR